MQLSTLIATGSVATMEQKFGILPFYNTIELMWLQDFSATFENDYTNLKRQVPDAFEELKKIFPHSRFGLGGFVDKPMGDFGFLESSDYCYQLKYPLTRYTDHVKLALEKSQIHSGKDWPESQLHAMLGASLSPDTRWSANPLTPNGYKIHRLLVVATDSLYHRAGDSDLPVNNQDGVENCLEEDYPSVDQVAAALDRMQITPLFLVTEDVAPWYRGLVKDLRNHGVVYPIKKDSSDIGKGVLEAVKLALGGTCDEKDECSIGCRGAQCCGGSFKCSENPPAAVLIKLDNAPKEIKVHLQQ